MLRQPFQLECGDSFILDLDLVHRPERKNAVAGKSLIFKQRDFPEQYQFRQVEAAHQRVDGNCRQAAADGHISRYPFVRGSVQVVPAQAVRRLADVGGKVHVEAAVQIIRYVAKPDSQAKDHLPIRIGTAGVIVIAAIRIGKGHDKGQLFARADPQGRKRYAVALRNRSAGDWKRARVPVHGIAHHPVSEKGVELVKVEPDLTTWAALQAHVELDQVAGAAGDKGLSDVSGHVQGRWAGHMVLIQYHRGKAAVCRNSEKQRGHEVISRHDNLRFQKMAGLSFRSRPGTTGGREW